MTKMSVEQAQKLEQEFSECKSLAEQIEFVKAHKLELEFRNIEEKEENRDGKDNKGSTKSN